MAEKDDATLTGITTHPASPGARQAYLFVITSPDGSGQMIRLVRERMTIGRAPDADIQIQDSSISRHHLAVTLTGGRIHLEDLGSKNGTFVRGEKVEQAEVEDGEKIQIGTTTIVKVSWQDALDEALQQNLYDAATRDTLTGVYNRKYLLENLDKEISFCRRHNVPMSVLMLDVDHFKKVNDDFGHLAGDEVLRQVSQAILESVRNEDLVARYGGEEFVLVLKNCDASHAFQLAERLRRKVEALQCSYQSHQMSVTVSMGVVELTLPDMATPVQLLEGADQCLYQAKNAGRNRVVRQLPLPF